MTIEDELLDFFIAHDPQQRGLKDRNIELFLYYFGFMDAALPNFAETGKAFGHKKQNAEPIINTKLNILQRSAQPLPLLHRFANIISSLEYIRSSTLTQQLIDNGLVASETSCSIGGLLKLVSALGYQQKLTIFDFRLKPVRRKDYSRTRDFLLIDKSMLKKLKKGIAKAKALSSDLGLVSCAYLLEQLGDTYKYGDAVCDLLTHKQENTCFIADNREVYFHVGGYKRDSLLTSLGKAFRVSETIHIDELAEAIQKPIRRRQTKKKVKLMLPIQVIKHFIETYRDTKVADDCMVSFHGQKLELNAIEILAEQFLREKGVVKYRELFEYLRSKGNEEEFCYAEMSYSSIFCKKRDQNGNYLISLIGTTGHTFVNALSFEDIIDDLESASQGVDRFQRRQDEIKETGHLGEKFVNRFLEQCKSEGRILRFKWLSHNHPGVPCDFVIQEIDGAVSLVDVKSTIGNFDCEIHISYGELCKMRENEQYKIFRVYFMKDNDARSMRISKNMKDFAVTISNWFESAPLEIIPDSISLQPSNLDWESEVSVP